MKWPNNILEIFVREFHRSIYDEGVLVFFIVVPFLYPLLYAYLYNNEVVREVPTVVVDNSHTSLSREFLRKVDGTADVKIVAHCADMQEAVELVHRRKAYCTIYIPKEFENEIIAGRQAVVELYSDMSGLLYYKAVLSSCTEVSLDMNKDIKAQLIPGATEEQILTFQHPIEYEYTPLFNTQSGFASYLIPGVLMLIIQQTMIFGVGMLAGDVKERKRKGYIYDYAYEKNSVEMLLGKSLAYFSIYAVMAAYLCCIVPSIFHLPHIWHWKTLLTFMFPYILSCVFFSITLSHFAVDREGFIICFVFTSVPFLFISGISWPGSAIPAFWKCFSWLFPSTFGINGFVRISNMGCLLKDVWPEFVALWIQVGFYFLTALLGYVRSYGKHLKDSFNIDVKRN